MIIPPPGRIRASVLGVCITHPLACRHCRGVQGAGPQYGQAFGRSWGLERQRGASIYVTWVVRAILDAWGKYIDPTSSVVWDGKVGLTDGTVRLRWG